MAWRDRLRAALAASACPNYPNADCANSAETPSADPCAEVLARSAQLASGQIAPSDLADTVQVLEQPAVASAGASLQRPPSWADAACPPPAGAWCSCCKGRRWWTEAVAPKGWRCAQCHPPAHLGADDVREVCPGMGQTPRVLNVRDMPGFTSRKPIIPQCAVYIGRAMPTYGPAASKWANPYHVDKPGNPKDGTLAEVLAKYEGWLRSQPALMACLPELRGRDLVCWCSPEACHGDLLLRLANEVGT